jgi:hypothetical protein
VRIVRKADGPVSITPSIPTCPQTSANGTEDWGFKFEGNNFALRNFGRDVHAPTLPGSCGFTPYTAGFLAMAHEFPDIPEVAFVPSPFPPVCTAQQSCAEDLQIWAHHHAVLVHMTSGEVADPQQNVGDPASGLSGQATDSGKTDILLRFIRQP